MGDEADYLIDQMFDDPYGEQDEDEPLAPAFKICRCCNEGGLEWGRHEGKWRLFKNGKLHVCKANPIKIKNNPKQVFDSKRVKTIDVQILALEAELSALKTRRAEIVGTGEDIPL